MTSMVATIFDYGAGNLHSVANALKAIGADGVQEFPLALVTLGGGAPAIRPTGEAATAILDPARVEFPLITQVQHAGDLDELGHPWSAAPPLAGESPGSADLDTVILQRGSTRLMDRTATVDRAVFDFSMAASLRGTRVPHFVAVHAVDRVEPRQLEKGARWEHPCPARRSAPFRTT